MDMDVDMRCIADADVDADVVVLLGERKVGIFPNERERHGRDEKSLCGKSISNDTDTDTALHVFLFPSSPRRKEERKRYLRTD